MYDSFTMDSHSSSPIPSSGLHFSPLLVHTPGSNNKLTEKGIDKKLLTPCRRVGLKRKSARCINSKDDCLLKSSRTDFCADNIKFPQNFSENVVQLGDMAAVLSSENESIGLLRGNNSDSVIPNSIHFIDSHNNTYVNKYGTSVASNFQCNSLQSITKNIDVNQGIPSNLCNTEPYGSLINKPDCITLDLLHSLGDSVKQKKEKCKQIELSHLYAKKHDLKMLRELTLKWKQGCQDALYELHSLLNGKGHNLSMSALLYQFQIPHDVIGYSEDRDEFE